MKIKTLNKLKITLTLLAIFITASVFFTSYLATSAQTNNTDGEDIKCSIEIKPFLKEKSKEFQDYLESTLSNKSKNSSLLDLVIERFQKYKKELWEKYDTYVPQVGFELYTETIDIQDCYQQVNQEIQIMEQHMRKYFLETSNIKTTSSLMSKLKQINAKLDVLNSRVTQMYGKWEALKDRLPCYTEQCL